MKHRKFGTHTQAVAGVIEALLMVALVAIIISMIQLVYIPQVMEQKEAEHMDLVSNQFSYLKSMIDLQTMTDSSAPISSMITLGSRELPYFITVGASGRVSIQNSSEWNISVDYADICRLTSITYEADNAYFVDQTYALEGGGIIVTQPDGESVMRANPSIFVTNGSDIQIDFDLPIINGLEGKDATEGNVKCFIRTIYSQSKTNPINDDVFSINISTQYPNAWYESLYDMLGENVNYTKGTAWVEITRKSKDIILNLECYYVSAQIGPGWIK